MSWITLLVLAILLILAFSDKTPKRLLYSILREGLKGTRYLRLPFPKAERFLERHNPKPLGHSAYQRIRREVCHTPLLLNLPTSEGSGEAAHPDVLHVEEGWGAGKWTYLMTATPYPSGNDYFENPEFYVSHDGVRWTTPEGGKNPLAQVPVFPQRRDLKKEFHSDPSLLLHEGVLHLYYRWTGVLLNGGEENRICVVTSADGIGWSESRVVLEEKTKASEARKFLSPSLLFLDGEFVMWTVEYERGERFIFRRTSADGLRWEEPAKTVLHEGSSSFAPWHLDVVEGEGQLFLILTTARDRGFDAETCWGRGDAGGRVWEITGKPFDPGYFFEGKRIYRSSMLQRTDGGISLYYSTMSMDGTWNVALLLFETGEGIPEKP